MAKHKERMSFIGKHALPPKGSPYYSELEKLLEAIPKNNPEIQKRFKHAITIIAAQWENGAGLQLDKIIRNFFNEYNDRNFKHGLRSMPVSFNVLEAFFRFVPDYFYFRLYEEKDHLFSFVEYLDYVTSANIPINLQEALCSMEDEVIYSFNVLNDPGDITFSISNGVEFAIGGVSLIKHGTEVDIFLLAGEKADLQKETDNLRKSYAFENVSGKEFIKPSEDLQIEAVPLMYTKCFWQTLVLTRIDLEEMTQSARYILKDIGNSFTIITDDLCSLMDEENKNISNTELEQEARKMADKLKGYDTIFELCKTSLYLPFYFKYYEELVNIENHPTQMHLNKAKWTIKGKNLGPREQIGIRHVAVLKNVTDNYPDRILYSAPPIKIDTSGYWQKIPVNEIGADKKGRPIHGRTWVQKTLTWVQENDEQNIIIAKQNLPKAKEKSSNDKGFIYVMRSAAHEKNIFKIGLTKRDTDSRSNELSRTTGSPDKFLVVQEWEVTECAKAEALIHEKLGLYRINPKREFFKAPYKEIVKVINEIIEMLEVM